MRLLYILTALWATASATFTKYGCYPESAVLLTKGDTYTYQSLGHCESVCSGDGVMGLIGGDSCYCGSVVPLSDQAVSLSNCDTACDGYGQENCGGSGYFLLYVDSSQSFSTADSSSSSTTSSSASKTSSSSSKTSGSSSSSKTTSSSADSSTTSDSSSSSSSDSTTQASVQTLVSTVTASASGTQVVTTTTLHPASTSSSGSTNGKGSNGSNNEDSKKSISTGGIVGAVIGSLAGSILIVGLIAFFMYKRKQDRDNEKDDEFTLSGPPEQKHPFNINNNPFLANLTDRGAGAMAAAGGVVAGSMNGHQHNNLNSFSSSHGDDDLYLYDQPKMDLGEKRSSEFGRRRLSDGSLPDMTRNPSTLKVVNN